MIMMFKGDFSLSMFPSSPNKKNHLAICFLVESRDVDFFIKLSEIKRKEELEGVDKRV